MSRFFFTQYLAHTVAQFSIQIGHVKHLMFTLYIMENIESERRNLNTNDSHLSLSTGQIVLLKTLLKTISRLPAS